MFLIEKAKYMLGKRSTKKTKIVDYVAKANQNTLHWLRQQSSPLDVDMPILANGAEIQKELKLECKCDICHEYKAQSDMRIYVSFDSNSSTGYRQKCSNCANK